MRYAVVQLTILSGQTSSPSLDFTAYSGQFVANQIFIAAPSTLPETVTVEASNDNSTWVALQSGGADITLPAAKGTQINYFLARYLRLTAGGAVGANRDFSLSVSTY